MRVERSIETFMFPSNINDVEGLMVSLSKTAQVSFVDFLPVILYLNQIIHLGWSTSSVKVNYHPKDFINVQV